MSGWYLYGTIYPFAYSEPPESLTLERTDHSETLHYVPERGECHAELPTCQGFPILTAKPHCSACGMEWGVLPMRPAYCPTCGRKVVGE